MTNAICPDTLERARLQIKKIANAEDAYAVNFWLTRTLGYLEALTAEGLIDAETELVLGAEADTARQNWGSQQARLTRP